MPANNVLVLQSGNKFLKLPAGQHVITNANTFFRAFYTLSQSQYTFQTKPAMTAESVPVVLDLFLQYRVVDPIALTKNYRSPIEAMVNPAQTAVNSIVARMSYTQFVSLLLNATDES